MAKEIQIKDESGMPCQVCQGVSQPIFSAQLLGQYGVQYFHCPHCGFLQTESPYWLPQAYQEPITRQDTGYVHRNLQLSRRLLGFLWWTFGREGRFLDYAGGYGMFVRLMRDRGLDFYWDDKYSTNLFARGFEKPQGLIAFDAVTSFESLEHFPDPMVELRQMFALASTVIFTTELLPEPIPSPQNWWYYGLNHGQHIAFYSSRTFHYIAQVFQARYFKVGPIHVLTQSPRVRPRILWASLCLAELGLEQGLRFLLKSKTWEDYHRMEQGNAST